MIEEYTPKPIRKFKGLWRRGGDADSCPPEFFQDCLNIVYTEKGFKTRQGCEEILATGTVKRIHLYKRINEATRLLILDDSGNLYDSTNISTPILTIAAMTDFSAVNMYNRVYISPHDGTKGLANEEVRVWDGTTMRSAGGAQPSGTLIAANSATAGNVEDGTHLFAVVYETASGFLTKPGPTLFVSVDADGTKKVDLSSIPTGPAGIAKRHIIATAAIQDYNGNQFGYEFFFVPEGTINDNSTTTLTINFYDSQLVASALYLFDVLDEIPAGLVINSYRNRLVVGNFDGAQFILRISKTAEPEVMDAATSIVVVDPTEAGGITNVVESRDLLGITKNLKSYITSDNEQDPNTWDVIVLDKGIGTGPHGISSILDSSGSHSDKFFMADRGGLVMFDGSFRSPELTWHIEDLWRDDINHLYFHTIQTLYDPINDLIYISVPLGAATSPSHVLIGDLSEGFDPFKVKWSIWQFPFLPTSIIIDVVNNTPIFKIAGDNIYQMADFTNDDNIAINSFFKTGLIPKTNNGYINHFNAISFRILGSGSIAPELRGEDDSNVTTPPNFTLSATPGGEILRWINYVGEKMSLRMECTSIDEHFEIREIIYYMSPLWSARPLS